MYMQKHRYSPKNHTKNLPVVEHAGQYDNYNNDGTNIVFLRNHTSDKANSSF
jgi:hypothetical protein